MMAQQRPHSKNVLALLRDAAQYNSVQQECGAIRSRTDTLTVFDSSEMPPISLTDYALRIATHSANGDEQYIVATIALMLRYQRKYFKQVASSSSSSSGSSNSSSVDEAAAAASVRKVAPMLPLNCHRMYAAASLVVAKLYSDRLYSNAHYAKICGIPLQELNRLERTFLIGLDWRTSVTRKEYDALIAAAQQAVDARQSQTAMNDNIHIGHDDESTSASSASAGSTRTSTSSTPPTTPASPTPFLGGTC